MENSQAPEATQTPEVTDEETTPSEEEGHEGKLVINPQSLLHAISVRFSDIKVISINSIPEIDASEKK